MLCKHAQVVSEDEVAGFRETLAQSVLLFVLEFAVFVLDVLAQTVQESHVQPLLLFAHVISEDKVAGFPYLFLQHDDFTQDVCGVAVFVRVGLLYHSQVLLYFPHCF